MPSQQTIEAVSLKVKKLKQLEEGLTKAVSARVNELHEECFKVMAADCESVTTLITFRLDCLSEFLQNLLIKVQDADQQMDVGQDTCKYPIGLKSISCLVERIDKLESAVEAKNDSALEAKIQELQDKVEKLSVTELQKSPGKGHKQASDEVNTELCSLGQRVMKMEQEKKLLEVRFMDEVDRIDREKNEVEKHVKGEVERIDQERQTMRAQLRKVVSKQKILRKFLSQRKSETTEASRVVAKKVSNLELLKDSLNKLILKTQSGSNTTKAIQGIQSDVSSVKASVLSLDSRMNLVCRPHVGFSARIIDNRGVEPDTVIKKIFDVRTNVGNCFKPHQGHFVAPHDGLYGFCVKVDQSTNVNFNLAIMSKDAGGEAYQEMSIPMYQNAPHSVSCILHLNKDRRIFLKVTDANGTVELIDTLTFSGWSIGYN